MHKLYAVFLKKEVFFMRDFLSLFTESAKEFTKVRSLVTTSLLVAVSMVIEMFSVDIGFAKLNFAFLVHRYHWYAVWTVHGSDGWFCLRYRGLSGTSQRRIPAGICAGGRLAGSCIRLVPVSQVPRVTASSSSTTRRKSPRTSPCTCVAILARLTDVSRH